MSEMIERLGMGWLPDYPDFRDYTEEQKSVKAMLSKVGEWYRSQHWRPHQRIDPRAATPAADRPYPQIHVTRHRYYR